ncbi:MAG: thrombospondin type 3 repeat-containing protein [Deltaproteobacteria bacterium]|nr:thrombospondin type 3 repeat-containing protein [Deltaproteobacteria bacterium]
MKNNKIIKLLSGAAVLLSLTAIPIPILADDFADYKDPEIGYEADIDLPTVEGGWFVAADYFPESTTGMLDGKFAAKGRIIAANNDKIYLQRTYGSSQFDVVGTVTGTMDPSFIHVSPDGSKIALGIGYGAPLLIIPTSVLSAASPPVLDTHASVKKFENVNYYEGDWADNRYFVIDGGAWPGPECTYPYHNDPDCVFESGVGSVDTQAADPEDHTGVLLTPHPGASADVEVTANGDLLVGIGYYTYPNRTGEIKVWDAADWDPATPNSLNYDTNSRVVAQNLLSGAHIGQDAEGNLHIGGGDAFGVGGPDENGYAALIKAGIVDQIADGIRTTPATDGNKVDNSEYKYFAPDACQDDSATGALADRWGRGLAVMWNPSGDESGGCAGSPGSAYDYWMPGVTPRLTIYYPGSALDATHDLDGDGIPNAADNAYLTSNPSQQDSDGDGYGDVTDADYDNDGDVDRNDFNTFRSQYGTSGPQSDFDADGDVDKTDNSAFRQKYGTQGPWY